jgi:hypothetical protein
LQILTGFCRLPFFLQGGLELETFFQAIAAAGLNGDISIDLMQAIW